MNSIYYFINEKASFTESSNGDIIWVKNPSRDYDGYRDKKEGTGIFNINVPGTIYTYIKIDDWKNDNPQYLTIGGPAGKVYKSIPLQGTLYNNMSVDSFANQVIKDFDEIDGDKLAKKSSKIIKEGIKAFLLLMEK